MAASPARMLRVIQAEVVMPLAAFYTLAATAADSGHNSSVEYACA